MSRSSKTPSQQWDEDTFWVLTLRQGIIRVSEEVAARVWQDIETGITEWVTFQDITGSTFRCRVAIVEDMFRSTPESRELDLLWNRETDMRSSL